MIISKGWGRNLPPVALLGLLAACGGDAQPAGDDAEPEVGEEQPVADEVAAEDTGVILPRTEEDDPGVEHGLVEEGDPAVDEETGEGGPELDGGAVANGFPATVRVPPGTRVRLVSEEDISTADYRVDDPVIMTVAEHVADSAGAVLIPQGVSLLGRVGVSAGSGGPGEEAILEISFETLSASSYERPVEAVVVSSPLVLEPRADAARRATRGRAAATSVVPGVIMAGSVVVVQLREAVTVPPTFVLPDSMSAMDTVPGADTVPNADTVPGADTVPPTDTIGTGAAAALVSYSRYPSAVPPRRGSDHPA